jgi:hypothetical protein
MSLKIYPNCHFIYDENCPQGDGGGGGGVNNPLTENLKLGGFSIVEELKSSSPSLNIDQLDPLKRIDLKINGLSKLEVEQDQVNLNENVEMNGNDINNVKDVRGGGNLNLLQVQNPSGLFYIDGGEIRLTADTSINLYPTGNLRLGDGSQDISINPTTDVNVIGNINMNSNSIKNLQNIDVGGGTLSINNTGFPAMNITGGVNFNNTGFIYQCPSVFAGAGNLDIGSDFGVVNIQTGPFGSRQTEIAIIPNLIKC